MEGVDIARDLGRGPVEQRAHERAEYEPCAQSFRCSQVWNVEAIWEHKSERFRAHVRAQVFRGHMGPDNHSTTSPGL